MKSRSSVLAWRLKEASANLFAYCMSWMAEQLESLQHNGQHSISHSADIQRSVTNVWSSVYWSTENLKYDWHKTIIPQTLNWYTSINCRNWSEPNKQTLVPYICTAVRRVVHNVLKDKIHIKSKWQLHPY